MFENFKRMATPRNITILMAIIGVFILIMVLKYFNLYEGLEAAPSTVTVTTPTVTVTAPAAAAAPQTPSADKASANKASADKAAASDQSTIGPSTNGPLIK